MDGISLTALADELLESAREGSSGRAARTIHGGHERVLRETVIAILEEKTLLLNHAPLRHSYPHCWRHKSPVIFRATHQWFIGMEHKGRRCRCCGGASGSTPSPTPGRDQRGTTPSSRGVGTP